MATGEVPVRLRDPQDCPDRLLAPWDPGVSFHPVYFLFRFLLFVLQQIIPTESTHCADSVSNKPRPGAPSAPRKPACSSLGIALQKGF